MKDRSEPSEAEVVAGCERGAGWARRALFERHHRAIFRFLVARCGNPDLAEDLVQETFIAAYGSISSFRGDARVETWMMRIALNCLYAAGRRGELGRRKLAEVEAGDPRAEWLHRAGRGAASGHAERDLLQRALARLDQEDAAVILLHDLQGYRYREIAETLDVAVGTVGSRLSRARGRLRRILEDLDPERQETMPADHLTSESEEGTEIEPGATASRVSQRIVWSER